MDIKKLTERIIPILSFKFPYEIDDFCEHLYLENYHSHSADSNTSTPDSPTSMNEYADKIKELGAKCLYTMEHGWQGNSFKDYDIAEENGLKYIHGTEAYWVKDRHESDRTNCHMVIHAKNAEGRKDINFMLSRANEDGYYYKPRADLDLLMQIPKDNVIITSACVAGWRYENADDIWLKIHEYFQDNFFFEIQTHQTDTQKRLNERILKLADTHNIQIICGLDSHYIKPEDDIKRDQILAYKHIHYEEEDGWYLDYPTTEEVIDRLKKQGVLSDEQIIQSILNTNIFASDSVEKIILNRDFKIPTIYPDKTYEEKVKIYHSLLNDAYKKEKIKSKEKVNGIKYEAEQVVDSGVVDYFLTSHAIIKDAVENEGGILTTTGRGSSASFITNKLLGLTTVDRFNAEVPMYPERFLTKDRVLAKTLPDIDNNLVSQEPFVRSSRKLLGEHGCYPLMAIEVLKEKSAWQMYASNSGIEPSVATQVSKYIDDYNIALKHLGDDEKDSIKIEDYIPEEFYITYMKSRDYQKIVSNLKCHACGYCLLNGDIRREIGLVSATSDTTKDRTLCAAIEGGYLDEFGLVKEDFLIVDSVGLTNEFFKSIGQPVPTFDELREMVRDDKPTWDIYARGITCCVNQCEQKATIHKVKKYKPQNLGELAQFIAAIRPGFASLLNNFLERKPYSTGEPAVDDLLNDTVHYMLYQESIMKILNFLGLPMASTYSVIKSISKKKLKGEMKENLLKTLKENWLKKIGNLDNFDNVWNVISDAARYSFNCVSGDTQIKKVGGKNGRFVPTVAEMYSIMHDKQYAKTTKHLHLHEKYKALGYGIALSMKNGRLFKNKILDIVKQPKAMTYTITTESGKKVIATINHKIPTTSGIKTVESLIIGDMIYSEDAYEHKPFDSSFTNGGFKNNYPSKGEQGFQQNPKGSSVLYHKFKKNKIIEKASCECCGKPYLNCERFEVHHKDFNRKHNEYSNYEWLCTSCHKKKHYQHGRTKIYENGIPVKTEKIVSIEPNKVEDVYDIVMSGEVAHNFVLNNGIVICNCSHALEMAGDSAYQAWFKAHHTKAFYEVAIEHYRQKNKKDKIEALIKEAMQWYGYGLGDYEYGKDNRKIYIDEKDNKIYPNLSSIKGFGETVVETLYQCGKNRTGDFLIELKELYSNKISTTIVSNLIRINYFKEYGSAKYLLEIQKLFELLKRGEIKSISKIKAADNNISFDVLLECGNESKTQFNKLDGMKLMRMLLKKISTDDFTKTEVLLNEKEVLEVCRSVFPEVDSHLYFVENVEQLKSITNISLYHIKTGKLQAVKMWTRQFVNKRDGSPSVSIGDVLYLTKSSIDKKNKQERSGEIDPYTGKAIYVQVPDQYEFWLKTFYKKELI